MWRDGGEDHVLLVEAEYAEGPLAPYPRPAIREAVGTGDALGLEREHIDVRNVLEAGLVQQNPQRVIVNDALRVIGPTQERHRCPMVVGHLGQDLVRRVRHAERESQFELLQCHSGRGAVAQ